MQPANKVSPTKYWEISSWAKTITMLNPQVLKDYKIIDTVGAGDCFTGAFAVKHSELDWSNK